MKISRVQLHRKLTALTGQSTSHYVRSYRPYRAKEFLESGQWNISEVAYKVGFKNLSYFSTSFSKEFGYSPRKLG